MNTKLLEAEAIRLGTTMDNIERRLGCIQEALEAIVARLSAPGRTT